jgi:hypothetical protein
VSKKALKEDEVSEEETMGSAMNEVDAEGREGVGSF